MGRRLGKRGSQVTGAASAPRASRSLTLFGTAIAAALIVGFVGSVGTVDAREAKIQKVEFPASGTEQRLTGYLLEPAEPGPRPAVVALHGCGGLFARYGGLSSRHLDWGLRLRAAGFVVLFPDSFGSRGFGSLCRVRPRPVRQRQRVTDAFAAHAWLAARPNVDPARIALLGWSNGGGTVLRAAVADVQRRYRFGIAFYPGCRALLRNPERRPAVPVHILIGGADDWTPPAPCIALSDSWGTAINVYPDAFHSFDTPGSPARVRRGMAFSADGSGNVHVGTHPQARAAAIREVMRILGSL